MSDSSDDDFWASVRNGTQDKSQENAPRPNVETHPRAQTKQTEQDAPIADIKLEPSDNTLGALESVKSETVKRRAVAQQDGKLAWQTTTEEPDGPPLPRRKRKAAKPVFLYGSILVAFVWVLSAGLFLSANASGLGGDGAELFGWVVLLLGPAAFAILAGAMGDSIARSNAEARGLMNAARRLLEPERLGEKTIRTTAHAVSGEIGRLESAIGTMAERLQAIEQNLSSRTLALSAASDHAQGGADALAKTMEVERKRLDLLLTALSDLTASAQNSTRTAAEGLDMRAAVLADVADSLVRKSVEASDVATAAATRLEGAAQRAVDAIAQLDQAATRGEAALARAHDLMVLARLRADEAVGNASGAVDALRGAADGASETVKQTSEFVQTFATTTRELGLSTVEEIRTAAEMNTRAIAHAMRAEADAARIAGDETLAALRATADAVRFAAEEAREQANQQLTENQRRLDSVRQTAFEAGKDADLFAQSRLSDARILIEQSAGLLDETGGRIQERFQKLAAACADQARSVEDVLDTLDRRLDTLPRDAEARAKAIEVALGETLTRLNAAGKRASEETAALDTAFQSRLRESYSALGEVVQRLGGLSGVMAPIIPQPLAAQPIRALPDVIPVAPPPSPPAPPPLAPPVSGPPAHAPQPLPLASPPLLPPLQTANSIVNEGPVTVDPKATPQVFPQPKTPPKATMAAQPRAAEQAQAQAPTPAPAPRNVERTALPPLPQPTKPRLQISSPMPVEDDPFSGLSLDENGIPLRTADGEWSWKEVLSTLDSKAQKSDATRIKELVGELSLRQRIDDPNLDRLRALATRSRDRTRQGTRETAPETVRALRRKMTGDPELRAALVRFVESRREAAARGRITGDEARLYLVVDAGLEA